MMRITLFVLLTLFINIALAQDCLESAITSTPISLRKKKDIVISGLRITNADGPCIELSKCDNITIINCVLGPSAREGILLNDCKNVTISNCIFTNNVAGVNAINSKRIQVNNNQFANVQYQLYRRQFVQFNKVTGPGNTICYNVGENILGKSDPEDLINIYKSNGTEASPILIKGNRFRGGGPSASGGGILAGDAGGSYITIEENILVNPGQYGIAIAGGHHIQILRNKIYGKQQYFTNVGIYVWNQYKPACHSNSVFNNEVNFTNMKGLPNSAWNSTNCGFVNGWDTNNWEAVITDTILPKRLLCPLLEIF